MVRVSTLHIAQSDRRGIRSSHDLGTEHPHQRRETGKDGGHLDPELRERREIQPDRTFSDLEMDSLSVVELILVVQNELGVQLSEDDATPDDTVAQVAERIAAHVARGS